MQPLVLSEDKWPKGSQRVWHVLRVVLDELGLAETALTPPILLQEPEPRGVSFTSANAWKDSTKTKASDFGEYLVEEIKAGNLVCIHVDGDRIWDDERPLHSQVSENVRLWREYVEQRVMGTLEDEYPDAKGALVVLFPFYSMESWLFLNSQAVEKYFDAHQKAQWDKLRSRHPMHFDGVKKPKKCISRGGQYNSQLAATIRIEHLNASPSFGATLERAQNDPRVVALIARLNADVQP